MAKLHFASRVLQLGSMTKRRNVGMTNGQHYPGSEGWDTRSSYSTS